MQADLLSRASYCVKANEREEEGCRSRNDSTNTIREVTVCQPSKLKVSKSNLVGQSVHFDYMKKEI